MDEPRTILISDPDTVAKLQPPATERGQAADLVVRMLVSEADADRLLRQAQDLVRKYSKNDDPRPSDDEFYDELGLPKF